jgi:hypothetical protein
MNKIEKEIEDWQENLEDSLSEAFVELLEVTQENIKFHIGEDEYPFNITYPSDYPQFKAEENFFVFSEEVGI